jgi:predicted DNA-binding ribbon-helix-helix protein
MKSSAIKRSIVVGGHRTSVSLEEAFWSGMKEISRARSMTLSRLVSEIDANRNRGNLSSAIRQFVLDYFKDRAVAPIGELRSRASHAQGLAESPLETM